MYEKKEFTSIDEAVAYSESNAKLLTEKLNIQVIPMCFCVSRDPWDFSIGYLKQALRSAKMIASDMSTTQGTKIAEQYLLNLCLIKDESDPRILSDEPENDPIYIGALEAAGKLVSSYLNLAKKK